LLPLLVRRLISDTLLDFLLSGYRCFSHDYSLRFVSHTGTLYSRDLIPFPLMGKGQDRGDPLHLRKEFEDAPPSNSPVERGEYPSSNGSIKIPSRAELDHSTSNIASAIAPRKARSITNPSRVAASTACAAASLSTCRAKIGSKISE